MKIKARGKIAVAVGMGMGMLVLITAVPGLYAMPFGEEGHERHEEFEAKHQKMMKQVLSEIGISDEQLAQIEAQRESQKENQKALRAKMKEIREALREELDKPETDRAHVDALIDEMNGIITQKIKARVESVLSLKEILTPEQFAQLRDKKEKMFKEHREMWKERGEHGKWGGRGPEGSDEE